MLNIKKTESKGLHVQVTSADAHSGAVPFLYLSWAAPF